MSEQINDRTAKAIKVGLRNMLESCGEMCGEGRDGADRSLADPRW